ncbi:hypothetical protein [Megasphaera sp. ASD88]|uniref:hypothetical protein n=1 Tax=Megasphaera sp. ASD88 TaxID=2027407 RepID=UPI00130474FC|nr:hypothetical protein [Megasphaera sp. ASD88]
MELQKEKTKVLQIRIEEHLLQDFNTITKKYSINKSELIRKWIEKYVNDHKEIE